MEEDKIPVAKAKIKAAGVPVTVYTVKEVLDGLIKAHLGH